MRVLNISVKAVSVVLAGMLACGCMLTNGVIDKAYDRYPRSVVIERIRAATSSNDTLFLILEVHPYGEKSSQTILFRIPFQDIGTSRHGPSATPLNQNDLSIQAPTEGYLEPIAALPDGVNPLEVEFVRRGSRQDLDDRIYNLPIGLHVLIMPGPYTKSDGAGKGAPGDGAVPDGAKILLVRRIPEHAPRQTPLWPFVEVREKHRAWLFLTPLAVVGDIVTSPFQLIIALGD